MPIYGLTTDGLLIKTLNVIREELNQRERDVFGNSIKVDDRAILGQINGIVSELAALVWELAEAVNSSQDPDKASGAALDALCTLTGTFRPPATFSTVTLTLTGTPATVVPAGNTAKTESTSVHFETTADGTITSVPAWLTAHGYVLNDRVTNAGNVYQCIDPGTSASAPTTTDASIVDGGVIWTYLGTGTGAIDVSAKATETGPLPGFARDISVIETPLAGWNSVINLLDASLGSAVASDEELRQLREAELSGAGNTPIDSLRADLLKLEGVKAVTVFVNNTDATDGDGMPPHSVEALVRPDGTPPSTFDQMIFDALLANVAAGIATTGSTPGSSTDSQGTSHTMKYSRPTEIPIYVIVNVTKDSDYPTNGDTLIKDAIVAYGDLQNTGKDAVASSISAQAFTVAGVLDVTAVKIGTAPSPTLSTTIAISLRQLATFDTSNISVVSIDGTP